MQNHLPGKKVHLCLLVALSIAAIGMPHAAASNVLQSETGEYVLIDSHRFITPADEPASPAQGVYSAVVGRPVPVVASGTSLMVLRYEKSRGNKTT